MGPEGIGGGGEQPMEDPNLAGFKEIAGEVLGVDPELVVPSARFKEDLDADSLDLVELVMGLEERFDIDITEEELEGVMTVEQALELVRKKRSEKDDGDDEGKSGDGEPRRKSPDSDSGSEAIETPTGQ